MCLRCRCSSLHLKSGVPRDKLSELHGNIFAEQCDKCPREYIRSFDVKGMGCSKTGRFCVTPGCGAPLRDKTIDWDSKLPDEEFEPAIENHQKADLALCLVRRSNNRNAAQSTQVNYR